MLFRFWRKLYWMKLLYKSFTKKQEWFIINGEITTKYLN